MLLSEHCSRYQNSYLFVIHNRLEGGTQSYLCLAIAHIPTDEPVHGLSFFHVLFNRRDCLNLVRCFHIRKGCFQLLLP